MTSRRALIVDDHRDSATMLAAVLQLRMPGLDVQVAHDGESALELVTAQSNDAVILDLALPGIGGAEVAVEIRRRCAGDAPLLIALSGSVADVARYQQATDIFDHALTKPANVNLLVGLLQSTIDHDATQPPSAGR